jgi:hypothetical protein
MSLEHFFYFVLFTIQNDPNLFVLWLMPFFWQDMIWKVNFFIYYLISYLLILFMNRMFFFLKSYIFITNPN